ncbi:hypothetical protein GX586_12905 [bacterium]|nr:hypothetical protein [bacterium]
MQDALNALQQSLAQHVGGNLLVGASVAFIGGVLTSLTPCVYPLLPIVVGVAGARQEQTRWRAFLRVFVYVTGLALVYTALGVLAASLGIVFGRWLSSPLLYFGVGFVFLLMGLSLFDVFQISIGGKWALWRPSTSGWMRWTGTLLLGAVSGTVAAPCGAPVLFAVLAVAARTHNVVHGAVLLMAYSYGIGLLLLLVGTFAGVALSLPKAGAWMEWIKKAMGFLFLLIACYFMYQAGYQTGYHAATATAGM